MGFTEKIFSKSWDVSEAYFYMFFKECIDQGKFNIGSKICKYCTCV